MLLPVVGKDLRELVELRAVESSCLADGVVARPRAVYEPLADRGATLRRARHHVQVNVAVDEYDPVEPTPDIQDLLDEIDRDPTSIFWG